MKKPRILLLPDFPNWAFDYIARSIAARLKHRFDFKIEYASRHPELRGSQTDLLYVFFWGYKVPESSGFGKNQVIKDIASFAWRHFNEDTSIPSKEFFVENYLSDCVCATTPSAELYREIYLDFPRVVHCPNGVEFDYFASKESAFKKDQPLIIGWVGNPEDEFKVKGLHDILIPAAEGFRFEYTSGNLTRAELREFYSRIDVLAIASSSETQPLPLLESMSAGCFPVTTNVGIVPEVIQSGKNGMIVERSVEAFRRAFHHCSKNILKIRATRELQKAYAANQSWDLLAERFGNLFDFVLNSKAEELVMPSNLVGTMARMPPMLPACKPSRPKRPPLFSKLAALKINTHDGVRRFFLGNRYGKSKLTPFYDRAEYFLGYSRAIFKRFSAIRRNSGLHQAFAAALKSFLRRTLFRRA